MVNEYGYGLAEPWDTLLLIVFVVSLLTSIIFWIVGLLWLRWRHQFVEIFAFEAPTGLGRYKQIEFLKPTVKALLTEAAERCAIAVIAESQLVSRKAVFELKSVNQKIEEMEAASAEVKNCIKIFNRSVRVANAFDFGLVYAWQSYLSDERKEELSQSRIVA